MKIISISEWIPGSMLRRFVRAARGPKRADPKKIEIGLLTFPNGCDSSARYCQLGQLTDSG